MKEGVDRERGRGNTKTKNAKQRERKVQKTEEKQMKERVDRERRGDKSERQKENSYDKRCSVLQMHEFGAKLLGKDLTKVEAFLNDIPDPMFFAMNARLLVPAKVYSEAMKTPFETGYWCQVCHKYVDDDDIFSRTT